MTCRRCKVRPKEGAIFDLCESCFDPFEAHIDAHAGPDGRYQLSDVELEFLPDGLVDRSRN